MISEALYSESHGPQAAFFSLHLWCSASGLWTGFMDIQGRLLEMQTLRSHL